MFGEATLKITFDSNNVKSSNFGSNSFQITNTGEKTIAQIDINVSNALYPDAVFDPFGEAGDTKSKPLTIDTNGGTGVVTPSNASYIGVGGTAGYEAIQLVFEENNNNGFEPGETIGFSVDMDPNSLAGTNKSQLDAGTNPSWDAGGVSGAELIGSTFTVTFTDNTTATGQLQGTKNQAGSQALASQDAPNLSVSLTVNGLDAGGVGTYDANGPSVIINGPAGQTARVVLTKGFIQPVTPYAQFLQDQLDLLAASDFPANNAVEFQTVDVLLTGGAQDISNLFDFSGVPNFNFEGEDQLPLGFVASIIDPAKEDLPIGPVTQPIYLEFQKQISENPPSIVTAASVTIPENQTEVLDVNATDANGDTPGNGLSFSLTGGEDLEAFAIDPNTGALSFTSAPDFENPGDKNGNNVYEVEVTVTDSTNLTDTQLIDVTVSDLNETLGTIEIEAEDIDNVSGYRIESKSIASGGQMLSLVGQDKDEVGTASFTFTGEPGNYNMILGLFDEGDGEASLQLTQNSNPLGTIILDENPGVNGPAADTKVERIVATGVTIANGDSFTITGFEDKGEHARFDFIRFVPVEGVSQEPPTITTAASVTVPENQTEILDVNAIDANGDTPGDGLSFSLTGGEDLEAFAIDPNTGALSFTSAPDFENPGDKNGNNVYEVEVTVTDSTNLTDTQLIDVTVSDLNETLGTIEIEAEDIDNVSGYRIESKSIASGGQMLSLVGQDKDEVGTASFTFTGEPGNYNMILGLFDEGDGEASLQLTQNSNPLGTIILDENPGVNGPAADTKVERIVATGVTIANGDSFTITGFEDKGEHARFDFIRFVPVEGEPPADSDIEPEPEPAIRINAGGEDYTDLNGNLWYADQYFSGGELHSTSDSINRTELDPIYQTERYLKDLSYDIPVNNGLYSVNLHFAEIHFNGPNQRNFDITIEEEVVSDLDIYASTKNAFDPGHDTALVVNFPQVQVTDGIIDIDLSASVNNSKISGIEIIPLQGAQVILQESQGATVVTENGNGDSYSLVLTEQPSTNVIIDIETDNLLETDKSQLIFTPQNWSTSQTVAVNALNNNQATGIKFGSISHSISSSDTDYDGYTIPDLSVKINDDDVVPIKFTQKTIATDIDPSPYVGATVGAWGPDGRLYVGSYNGTIKVFSFDDDYNLIETEVIDTLEGESNPSILGIAFNPFDSSDNPQIYVSHSQLYANGGGAFPETELSPYSGQISVLSGPNFSNLDPLITGLPVSNHDHGVNDIIFDNKGDLYVAIGGNTNAGITNAKIGGIPESPFSAAILKAEITKPDFNGTIEYSLPDDFEPPAGLTFDPATSQVFGDIASVVPGVDVSVYASGFRNALSLLLTTDDLIYTVENGANASFGDVSTSATTQEPFQDQKHNDELNLVVENGYYGFPNRNRGLTDDRQNKYYAPFESSQDGYTAPLVDNLVSSSNGLDEYRANSFGGQLKGDLIIQKINVKVSAFSLSEDGSQVVSQQILDNVADGLDIFTAPRGAIVGVDFWDDKVSVALPDDASIGEDPTAVDIFPWRAPATGGNLFIIGGHNFGDLENTSVSIGGEVAQLSSVSDGLIYGTLPSFSNPSEELFDVIVESAGYISVLDDAFLALA